MRSSHNPISLNTTIDDHQLSILRRQLLEWFRSNGRRSIPWKLRPDGTRPESGEFLDPYGIWVAEVMLQQTQLKTVLPFWNTWITALPKLVDLANAKQQDVLLLWQGLGYYSRARRIHQTSKILFNLLGSKLSLDPQAWIKDLNGWIALPGIGRSTAGSIISSAFDLPEPILDVNVRRVISRLISRKVIPDRDLWILSEQLLDRNNPRDFNQALMDLGALICTPKKPSCNVCPLQKHCIAFTLDTELVHLFFKPVNKKIPLEVIGVGIVLSKDGKVLIDQRLNDGLLGGMWEFPGGKQEPGELIEVTIARELMEELGIEIEVGPHLITFDHSYSHKKLKFVVHLCFLLSGEPQPIACQEVRWIYTEAFEKYPFPAANAKMISALIKYLREDKSREIS